MQRLRVMIVAGCLIVVGAVVPTHPGLAAPPVQTQSVPAASTLAVITTISVDDSPAGVAVNDDDDTVYVVNSGSNTVSVINGRTGLVDDTVTVGSTPVSVAVNQNDDTVYVTNSGSGTVSVINGRSLDDSGTIPVGNSPRGVAVDQGDDTVYVTNWDDSTLSVINGRTGAVDATIGVGFRPNGVAVNDRDDSVYVTNQTSNTVSVINGRTGTEDDTITVRNPTLVALNQNDDTVYVTNNNRRTMSVFSGRSLDGTVTIGVGFRPTGVAVDQGDGTVYVTNYINFQNLSDQTVTVINGRSLDDTVTIGVGSAPNGVAVDGSGTNAGLVYVTDTFDNTVSVIARVSASLGSAFAEAGSTVTLTLAVPQVDYDVDDSTVTSVVFGDDTATGLTAVAGDAWTLTVPAGSGTVPVTVTFNGGLTASAGSFTYGSAPSPSPNPPVPASAPIDVTATAGDASAEVSWASPDSPGSFPVSNYQVRTATGSAGCLVPASSTACMIGGLRNGTEYEVQVRALTGAGWGPWSDPVSVMPQPPAPVASMMITGSRDGRQVQVDGVTIGMVGQRLTPWVRLPGQSGYTPEVSVRKVNVAGDFTWQRQTNKKVYVYFWADDGVRSNRVIIPAR